MSALTDFFFFIVIVFRSSADSTTLINLTIQLPDNLPADTPLGNISSHNRNIPPPKSPKGYYRVIMNPNRFADRYFRVDPHTSGLFTKANVDRDVVCRQLNCCDKDHCGFNFTVFIRLSPQNKVKVNVIVSLRDQNDNPPVIQTAEISLPESTPVGSTRPLPIATDQDSPGNGILYYSLIDHTETFSLVDGTAKRPRMIVRKPLDSDDPQRRTYVLLYSATDKGNPPLTGKVSLKVQVMDENDNPPVFENEKIKTQRLREDVRVGTEIYQFKATDKDADLENSRISYFLHPERSVPPGIAAKRFEVSPFSGIVSVRSHLDYDVATERKFVLVIEARDAGSPLQSATASLTVELQNVNDNDPVISVTNSQPLLEESRPGRRVRTISVSDADDDSNITVTCSLENSEGFAISSITQNHYFDIVTRRAFDYETLKSVDVTIVCTDLKPPQRTTRKTFTIPIVDVNDHRPIFTPSFVQKNILENAPLGTEILTVLARDKDSGKSGQIIYSLDQSAKGYFDVDSRRGILYVNSTLDRERTPVLNFSIWATDMGTPPHQTGTEVYINLTDVNDNAPKLITPRSFKIVENIRIGTVITRVRFKDPDAGRNGRVSFRLIRDNNISLKYLNLSKDGRVIVTRRIDREVTPRMYLDIQARDHGTPILETTVSLLFRVLDLNDNSPRLISPENRTTVTGTNGRRVYVNSPFNTTVVKLYAKDGDLKENGSIEFEILSSNATGMFKIDKTSGRIYTVWTFPSQPTHGLYQMKIRLQDRGSPSLSTTVLLFVAVGPPSSDPEGTGAGGISKIIILVLVLIASVALITTLVMAALWVRIRSKRASRNKKSIPDYGDYDPAVKQTSTVLESEIISNSELTNGVDVIGALNQNHKTLTRMNQYVDYTNPYPVAAAMLKRDQRNQLSFEGTFPNHQRTFGHQSSPSQSFPLETYATTGRHGSTSPPSFQQRPNTVVTNAHLFPELFEDDPRQSELSYDDSGKGGSLDDIGRLVLGQHVTSACSVIGYPHHPAISRMTLRPTHPGGPGQLSEDGAETMC